MVNISIDVTDLGGEARPGDKVVLWKPAAAGSATHAGRVISTAPVDVFLTNGKATVPDVEPGSMRVLLQCRGVESQGPIDVSVPDGTGTVTLRSLIEAQFEYAPPIVSAVQEAAANASASERAAIEAQVRSEAAADRADAKVDDAINNGANLVRAEVKQDADRAVSARQAATQSETNAKASESAAASSASNAKTSETNAKQSETNAGDFAAVATTAATEAVDAMERATDLAGGDFATHEYVDEAVVALSEIVVSSNPVRRIITSADPETPLAEGDLLLVHSPASLLVNSFADLDGISFYWNNIAWSLASDPTAAGGTALRGVSSNARALASIGAVNGLADLEIVSRVKASILGASVRTGGLVLRGSGVAGSENGYLLLVSRDSVHLAKFVAGKYTELMALPASKSAGEWYWLRFRARGSQVQAKFWLDGETEPSDWLLSATDESLKDGGRVGTMLATGGGTILWDFVGVAELATGDESAPVVTP